MCDSDWRYLKVDGEEYSFNTLGGEREWSNVAQKKPERLAAMLAAWQVWNATMSASGGSACKPRLLG